MRKAEAGAAVRLGHQAEAARASLAPAARPLRIAVAWPSQRAAQVCALGEPWLALAPGLLWRAQWEWWL